MIWKGFLHTISWMGSGLIWKVGNRRAIRLGLDPIVGQGSSFLLPFDLREYLEDYGICTLDQARNHTSCAQSYWLSAIDLDLQGEWKMLWDSYIAGMEYGRIRLSDPCDSLLWSYNHYVCSLSAAQGYECIASSLCSVGQPPVLDLLWDFNIPKKIVCFIWLTVRNRILTWEQLQHRGKQGPTRCILCCRCHVPDPQTR